MKLTYNNYFDKVYGCWLGKAISGNIGAPYEGMKQLLNFEYSTKFLDEMLPNDDLDLQVLWLEVLEEKGIYFTSDDLAEKFAASCDYAPGEYAYFKKNYYRGIPAPYAGTFNNEYFKDGMGAPIRSEIWACISPNNSDLAVKLSEMDAIIDHSQDSNSLNGEKFYAAIESMAFAESDIFKLIKDAMKYIDFNCKLHSLIEDVIKWCEKTEDWHYIRSKIIRKYGSVEATSVLQNTGFIVMSLLLGGGDFIKTTMMACNCGFDTDCTAATVGAMLGIIIGADKLINLYSFNNITYKLGVKSYKTSPLVEDLAKDVAKMGIYFNKELNKNIEITDYKGELLNIPKLDFPFEFRIDYNKEPSIGFGEDTFVIINLKNLTDKEYKAELNFSYENPLESKIKKMEILIKENETKKIIMDLSVSDYYKILPDANIICVELKINEKIYIKKFGLAGKKQWRIFGPYWKNIITVPKLDYKESYWNYFKYDNTEELMNAIRHYHMNSLPETSEKDINIFRNDTKKTKEEDNGKLINIGIDEFKLENYEKFNGQATFYLVTSFFSNKEFKAGGLQIGYSDEFKFYLNGKLIAERFEANMFTPENIHKFDVDINKGENTIIVMLVKHNENTKFSFNFLKKQVCSEHLTFDNVNLK